MPEGKHCPIAVRFGVSEEQQALLLAGGTIYWKNLETVSGCAAVFEYMCRRWPFAASHKLRAADKLNRLPTSPAHIGTQALNEAMKKYQSSSEWFR